MNNNEAIDQAIAMLEKLREPRKPRERWGVMDCNDDIHTTTDKRVVAEMQQDRLRCFGTCKPYCLVRITEVIE